MRFFILVIILINYLACNTVKHLNENEYLYNKVFIDFNGKKNGINRGMLKANMALAPNQHLIEISNINFWKFKLNVYNLFYKKNQKKKLKTLYGEPPVLFDSIAFDFSAENINKFLFKKGFFNSSISHNFKKKVKAKKVNGLLNITLGNRYKIKSITYNSNDSSIQELLTKDNEHKFILKGDYYDEFLIDEEINRLVKYIKNQGYYNFTRKNINVIGDTLNIKNKINITFNINKSKKEEEKNAFSKYYFDTIVVNVPSLNPNNNSNKPISIENEKYFIHPNFEPKLSVSKVILPRILINKDDYFNFNSIQKTFSNFNSLNSFSSINIDYFINDSINKKLKTNIKLELKKKYNFSTSFQAFRRTERLGISFGIDFEDRNFLRKLINYKIGGKGFVNFQFSTQDNNIANTIETFGYSVNFSIRFPLMFPNFFNLLNIKKQNASTLLDFKFEDYIRNNFSIRSIIFGYGFKIESLKKNIFHNIKALNFEYDENILTDEYRKVINTSNDEYLINSFKNIISIGLDYQFNYSNFIKNKSFINFYTNINTVGDFFGIINLITNNDFSNRQYSILEAPYAQFFKFESILRKHWIFNKSTFAFKFHFGIRVPYGNSTTLPYNQSFFISGFQDLRGWRSRSLGPGAESLENVVIKNNQVGDIKIVTNLEYRFDVYKSLKSAIFTDIGNIWLLTKNINRVNAEFNFENFYEQFGISIGTGIRYDFNLLVLVLDLGTPIYDPSKIANERWAIDRPWVISFGFNYPF